MVYHAANIRSAILSERRKRILGCNLFSIVRSMSSFSNCFRISVQYSIFSYKEKNEREKIDFFLILSLIEVTNDYCLQQFKTTINTTIRSEPTDTRSLPRKYLLFSITRTNESKKCLFIKSLLNARRPISIACAR